MKTLWRMRLDLQFKLAAKNLKVPHLIIHGDADTSVDLKEAFALHEWHPRGQLLVLKGANHVFGSHHPWDFSELPLIYSRFTQKSPTLLTICASS